jgi:hypothetical protein
LRERCRERDGLRIGLDAAAHACGIVRRRRAIASR